LLLSNAASDTATCSISRKDADGIVPVCAGRLGAAVVGTGEAVCCDSSAGPADPAGIDPPHAENVIKKEAGVATRARMPLLSPALP
jgi:hypothetical protein